MYKVKGEPWSYPGSKDVSYCNTSADVMSAAGLDWEVDKCSIYAGMPNFGERTDINNGFIKDGSQYKIINNNYATYRCDTNIPLGIVKGRYTPVQNTDAFNFFDSAIGKNKAVWDTAGFFGNGERIFVSAKLPKNIIIGNNDPIDNYLVFTNTHDGSGGVNILYTPIRIVCKNCIAAAVKNASDYVSFRHTKSVHEKLDIANEILGICEKKINYIDEVYQEFYKTKLNDKDALNYFANVILTENEIQNIIVNGYDINHILHKDITAIEDCKISTRKANILSDINDYYFTGIGQQDYIGTVWGAYNAITGYYSNVVNSDGSKRMDSILYGDRANKIKTAANLALHLI